MLEFSVRILSGCALARTRFMRAGRLCDRSVPDSFLDTVLRRKLGLPITLSVLYAVVCRELRVPVELVGMVRTTFRKCVSSHCCLRCEAAMDRHVTVGARHFIHASFVC